jgi:hypothetical protein
MKNRRLYFITFHMVLMFFCSTLCIIGHTKETLMVFGTGTLIFMASFLLSIQLFDTKEKSPDKSED